MKQSAVYIVLLSCTSAVKQLWSNEYVMLLYARTSVPFTIDGHYSVVAPSASTKVCFDGCWFLFFLIFLRRPWSNSITFVLCNFYRSTDMSIRSFWSYARICIGLPCVIYWYNSNSTWQQRDFWILSPVRPVTLSVCEWIESKLLYAVSEKSRQYTLVHNFPKY